jgi:hypothetical protein
VITSADMMGRVIATDVVRPNDTHRTRRVGRARGWTYVMATSVAGGTGVAIR